MCDTTSALVCCSAIGRYDASLQWLYVADVTVVSRASARINAAPPAQLSVLYVITQACDAPVEITTDVSFKTLHETLNPKP